MLPVAFTERTAAQPAVVVGAVEENEFPSVEYESVQPFGYLMSETDVNCTFVGSIDWTISWLTVPAPTTGIPAVRSTVAPGDTVELEAFRARTGGDADAGNDWPTSATVSTSARKTRAEVRLGCGFRMNRCNIGLARVPLRRSELNGRGGFSTGRNFR